MNRKWTEAQYNAIAAEGGNVLVSAAAGSGKTAVLVERVIQRLTDLENPTPADRILVATFTNAAAAEMKERIAARLTELLEQNPGDSYLMRQRMMLDTASIGTVHAFCLGIIRNNLHLLQVPPDFRIGDEKELNILKEDIAKELLEEYYSVGNKTFADMVELFSTGRDDSRVLGAIFQLYSFVRSHPFYNSWLDSKLLYYSNDLDAEQTLWGKTILNYAEKTVQYAAFMNDKALELIKQDDTLTEKYTVYFEQTGNQLRELAAVIRTGCWDTVYGAVNRFSFEKLPIVRGMKDSFLKNQAMNYRDKIKDIINELSLKQFCCDNQGFKQDIKMLYPVTAMLFEITKEFDRRYTLAKFSRKMIDFSDIEHFAIALLLEEKDGEHILTPLAKELRERYMYVLVDEYQDSNEAQDLIFSSVSNGKNLFMVGDVKQSIYRFRQAMPEIFLAKKNSFPLYDGENYPAKIILGNNFRSRRQVTETVNMIFGMLMSEDLGELYYNDEEMLVPLANYPENDDCTTELCLLEYNGDEELSAVEAEAEFVAEKIDAMIKNGFKVNEKGVLREIKAGDIAILMRSLKGKGDIFLKALANVGIKAVTQDKSSFLAAREISVVMSMLRVINNPLNDICLTAVMLSPAFDFTPTDIAKIRMINRSSAMIVNCIAAAEQGDERCQSFIKILDSLRLLATTMPVSRLIVKILEATDFSGVVAAMNNAEVRTANLRLLCEYAAKYEQSGSGGLGGFVAFIDRLEQRDDDLGGAELGALEKNCVRIMSIHASKGLE
ncbi:MAG: UvrD-helicase domain-containing protein, partial [Oscillospiraceae bacterium]